MSDHSDNINDFSSDDEQDKNILIFPKKSHTTAFPEVNDIEQSDESEGEPQEETGHVVDSPKADEEESKDGETGNVGETTEDKALRLRKRLELVNALKKSKHKTGVIYLSRIPPYMKPAKMRQILSRFGQLDRLFLKREDESKYRQRIKGNGNKKNMYEEGWAEFIRKRDAKLCAETLNGNIIGGKKGTFYHDDILNVKYLPGFKWADLTEQIARENDIRHAKLEMEISQANKLNAEFIRNVEKSKMLSNMNKAKKRKAQKEDQKEPSDEDVERQREQQYKRFQQHKVSTNRASAPENIKQTKSSDTLGSVLSNLL
ncbi:RNA-binding ATPase activator ESF2 KNAG_0D00140 [Huiozyma naganishii CBS 8797]|uniref:Pre-rRNA-processing protein ESF2 n=1 Tax=Huiozyma naganishii (strain ATCC MYA-139 / BCRC 22969 / CBS 8797 / KCTC 17520 / NBRC 10181 / NCYC 3082 / Yp74L-3) TaxID=1071383 RepID=J7S6H5_HUIN7|nr:hypothetical protein KNAG_0D00140 [Kazachstania naganishii CBS 8797]CCK69766.1 hypothetical protein KNAG_0D00140 [Kazachstania naganishii CBS 8797]